MSTKYHEHYPTPEALGVKIQARSNPFCHQQTGTAYENAAPAFSHAHRQELQEDEFRSQVLRMFHELEARVRHRQLSQAQAAKELKLSVPSYIALRKSNKPSMQLVRRWFPQIDDPKASKEALGQMATGKSLQAALYERQDVAEAVKVVEHVIKGQLSSLKLEDKGNDLPPSAADQIANAPAFKEMCKVETELPSPTAALNPSSLIHTVSQRAATQVVNVFRPKMERVVASNPRLKPWLTAKKLKLDPETGMPAPSLTEEIAGIAPGNLRALFAGNQLRQQPNADQLYYLPASKRAVVHTAAALLAAMYLEGHPDQPAPAEATFHAVMGDRLLFKRTSTHFPMALTGQAQAALYELTDRSLTEVRIRDAAQTNAAYGETATAYLATNFARALACNSLRIRTMSASEIAQVAMLFGVHPHSLALGQLQWAAQMGAFSSLGARKVAAYGQMIAVWSSGGNKHTERLLEESWMARWAAPYRMAVKSDFNQAWRNEDYHKVLGVFVKVAMKYQLGQINLRSALSTLAQTAGLVRELAMETGIDQLVYPSAAGATTMPNSIPLFLYSQLPWMEADLHYCKEVPHSVFGATASATTDVMELYREPEDLASAGMEEYVTPAEELDSELKGLINKGKAATSPSGSLTATSVVQEVGKIKTTPVPVDDWSLDDSDEEDRGAFFMDEDGGVGAGGVGSASTRSKSLMPNIKGADGSPLPATSDFD